MTFPLVCYCMAVPKPVLALFKLLNAITLAFVLTLSLLGLYQFPYTVEVPDDHAPLHTRRRSAAGEVSPETVKKRLPPVEWVVCHDDGHGEVTEPTCTVCLEKLEEKDEVRRLGNCTHAFHRGCIDQWIDLGQATCPLCRSHLVPRQRRGLLGWARFASFWARDR